MTVVLLDYVLQIMAEKNPKKTQTFPIADLKLKLLSKVLKILNRAC